MVWLPSLRIYCVDKVVMGAYSNTSVQQDNFFKIWSIFNIRIGIIKIKFIFTRTTHILTYKTKVETGLVIPSQNNVNQNGKQFMKAPDKLMSSIYLY